MTAYTRSSDRAGNEKWFEVSEVWTKTADGWVKCKAGYHSDGKAWKQWWPHGDGPDPGPDPYGWQVSTIIGSDAPNRLPGMVPKDSNASTPDVPWQDSRINASVACVAWSPGSSYVYAVVKAASVGNGVVMVRDIASGRVANYAGNYNSNLISGNRYLDIYTGQNIHRQTEGVCLTSPTGIAVDPATNAIYISVAGGVLMVAGDKHGSATIPQVVGENGSHVVRNVPIKQGFVYHVAGATGMLSYDPNTKKYGVGNPNYGYRNAQGMDALFETVTAIAFDPVDKVLYATDNQGVAGYTNAIRAISIDPLTWGAVTTLSGPNEGTAQADRQRSKDDPVAENARFLSPRAMTVWRNWLLVVDGETNSGGGLRGVRIKAGDDGLGSGSIGEAITFFSGNVGKVVPDKAAVPFGTLRGYGLSAVATDKADRYVYAVWGNVVLTILDMEAKTTLNPVLGAVNRPFAYVNGPLASARFADGAPLGLAVRPSNGAIVLTDQANYSVRMIAPS